MIIEQSLVLGLFVLVVGVRLQLVWRVPRVGLVALVHFVRLHSNVLRTEGVEWGLRRLGPESQVNGDELLARCDGGPAGPVGISQCGHRIAACAIFLWAVEHLSVSVDTSRPATLQTPLLETLVLVNGFESLYFGIVFCPLGLQFFLLFLRQGRIDIVVGPSQLTRKLYTFRR